MVEDYEGPVKQAWPLAMMHQGIDGPRGRYPLARRERPQNAGRSVTRETRGLIPTRDGCETNEDGSSVLSMCSIRVQQ